MGYRRSLDQSCSLQFELLIAEIVEQSAAIAEQDGYKMNLYLVEQPEFQELLNDARTGRNQYVFVTRRSSGLFSGACDAVTHKGKRRASFLDQFFPTAMREHEHGFVEWRVIAPMRFSEIKHAPAHQHGPSVAE